MLSAIFPSSAAPMLLQVWVWKVCRASPPSLELPHGTNGRDHGTNGRDHGTNGPRARHQKRSSYPSARQHRYSAGVGFQKVVTSVIQYKCLDPCLPEQALNHESMPFSLPLLAHHHHHTSAVFIILQFM